jgi:hypothetical protein
MFEKNKYSSRRFKPLKVLFFVAVFIAFATALSWLVMYLWNTILVDVAGVKPLNFWKAAGLLALAKILFGGFGGRKAPWKHSKRKDWKNKWMAMNDEERQEAKSRWKEHCKSRETKEKSE